MNKLAVAAVYLVLALSGSVFASPLLVVVNSSLTQVPNAGPWPVIPLHASFTAGPNGAETIGTDETPPIFPFNIPSGTEGYAGMYLELLDNSPGAPATESVTFTMLGHGDSTFNNEFRLFANQSDLATRSNPFFTWTQGGTAIGTTATVNLPVNTLLPFLFTANLTGPSVGNNGSDNQVPCDGANCSPAFGVFDVSQTALNQGRTFWLGFSDGGAPTDYDQQDLVIRASVPEPGSLLLLTTASLLLGALRRRER